MIYLYTAPPGTGKTCWVVKQLVDNWIPDPNNDKRAIYSNINGLKIEGIRELPDDGDFRKCEDGSIIIIDEPQDIDHYNSDSRGFNPVAKALSKHRHRGFDIHFITQDPSLLHKYVLKNVYLHYYLWRPAQRKAIEIYTFARAIVSPTTNDFKNAYDKIWWRFEEHYLQYYKSTVLNTSQKTGSTKRNSVITTFIIFMLIIAYFMYPALKPHLFKDEQQSEPVSQRDDTVDVVNAMQPHQSQPQPQQTADPYLQQYPSSVPVQSQNQYQLEKEQQEQLHKKYLSDYTVEVANDDAIRPASLMMFSGKCHAYNMYGDKLNITQSHCKEMLKNGTMPKSRNQSQSNDLFNQTNQNQLQPQFQPELYAPQPE